LTATCDFALEDLGTTCFHVEYTPHLALKGLTTRMKCVIIHNVSISVIYRKLKYLELFSTIFRRARPISIA